MCRRGNWWEQQRDTTSLPPALGSTEGTIWRKLMKGRLLISVTAALLAVGSALVYAEPGGPPGGKGGGSPGAQTPDTPPGSGDKKGQPKTEQPGSKQGTQRKE